MNAVLDATTGDILEHRQLAKGPDREIWRKDLANNLGRLAQGVGSRMTTGMNAIKFIHPKLIPQGKKSTYCKLVASIRPLKAEKNRVRVTIGGDRLEYEGNMSTTPATLTTVKTHLNSTMPTKEGKHMTEEIKYFYYGTSMQENEHGHLPVELIPQEIMTQCNLDKLASKDKVCFEIQKGMPGLKQVGIISHNRLSEHLTKKNCILCQFTPSPRKYKYLPISFTLVGDDLIGIKYIKKRQQNI